MFIRLFFFAFSFGVLFFSVSDKQHRTVAAMAEVTPFYDASYKL